MPRGRDGGTLVLLLVALVVCALLASVTSCGDEPEPNYAQEAIQAHRRLSEVRDDLSRAQERKARTESDLATLRSRVSSAETMAQERDRQAKRENMERMDAEAALDAADQDFLLACIVGFSCVLVVFMLLHLLLREQRQRMVLVRFFQLLKGRNGP